MKKFGVLKNKILKKITNSFTHDNKNGVKDILKMLKENRELKELYLLYEDIENKEIENYETAKLYVDELSLMLKNKSIDKNLYETLSNNLKDIECENNHVYDYLDVLSQKDSLLNIENKVLVKKKLVNHLLTKKQINESKNNEFTNNENLLIAVLTNNFNVVYDNTLNEDEKKELKDILALNESELKNKINEIKNDINDEIEKLNDEILINSELNENIQKVKKEISEMNYSKLNFYRLLQLKNGFK